MRIGIGFRHCALGCPIGLGVFVGLCFLAGVKPLEKAVEKLMLPGALLSSVIGFGRDDIQGVLLYLGGNAVFYALVSVVIVRLITGPIPRRNHTQTGD